VTGAFSQLCQHASWLCRYTISVRSKGRVPVARSPGAAVVHTSLVSERADRSVLTIRHGLL